MASAGPSKLNEGPGADLRSLSCFSLVEMESQLPLLGAKVPFSPGKACVEKALLQMGPKPPFFIQCSPAPQNAHLGVWEPFCVGLTSTSQKPIFHRALYFSVHVTTSPSLRVRDTFIQGNTIWCGGCNSLWGIQQVGKVSGSVCAHVCKSACMHACLHMFL